MSSIQGLSDDDDTVVVDLQATSDEDENSDVDVEMVDDSEESIEIDVVTIEEDEDEDEDVDVVGLDDVPVPAADTVNDDSPNAEDGIPVPSPTLVLDEEAIATRTRTKSKLRGGNRNRAGMDIAKNVEGEDDKEEGNLVVDYESPPEESNDSDSGSEADIDMFNAIVAPTSTAKIASDTAGVSVDKKGNDVEIAEEDEDDEEEDDDRLEDDDYDLLEENLGIKMRKRRFKRLKRMVDSDDESDTERQMPKLRRAESIMASDDDEAGNGKSDSGSDDDFIVDEDDRPISRRIAAVPEYCDANILEAREIFGTDFDYGDLSQPESDDENRSDESDEGDSITGSDGESRVSRRPHKKVKAVNVAKVYEPAALEEAGITDEARRIRQTDLPERFLQRRANLPPTGSELSREAAWIYVRAFAVRLTEQTEVNPEEAPVTPTAVNDDEDWGEESVTQPPKPVPSAKPKPTASTYITKITNIIKLMRDDKLEVPYIYFYQRDLTRPEFSLYDLWKIADLDEEYCRIHGRRQRLVELFANMKAYQESMGEEYLDRNDVRAIADEDFKQIHATKDLIELDDIQALFLLYYADDVPKMKEFMEQKRKELEQFEIEEGLRPADFDEEVQTQACLSGRHLTNGGAYRICKRSGIGRMLPLIGLTADEFGENFEAQFAINYTHQTDMSLQEVLQVFANSRLKETSVVAAGAKRMFATNISRDIRTRKILRNIFLTKATISVSPTRKGLAEIDENHPVFPLKFLKDKPVTEMDGIDFMELTVAEKSGLINMKIGEFIPGRLDAGISLVDEAKTYFKAESETTEEEWDKFRESILEFAFEKLLYPEFRKEVRYHLLKNAAELILQRCSDKAYSLIKDAPFTIQYEKDTDDGDWDTSEGICVLALAYDEDTPVHGVVIDRSGYVKKNISVTNFMTKNFKARSFSDGGKELVEADTDKLRELIEEMKPHVIVIGGENRGALTLRDEMLELLHSFPEWEINFQLIPVHVIDNEVAKVYSRTTSAMEEFPGTSAYFRQAVSLGRYLQDPLLEVSQLCNKDEDILSLHYSKYQHYISKEELTRSIEHEFINRACETGIDINEAMSHKHRSHALQFLSGLGPQKANALLRKLRQTGQGLENRKELVHRYDIGPIVYKNCAGFFRLKELLPEDALVDPRDQTRIHPQYYEYACNVAKAVLPDEYEDLELSDFEIMEKVMVDSICQENLLNLDLTDYLEDLKTMGFGDLTNLFESIIAELLNPYQELRKPFRFPDTEEMFYLLTKETVESVREAKLLMAYVNDARYRKPTFEDCNTVVPLKDPFSKRTICPYCTQDFGHVDDLWNHYDTDSCPGEIYAIHITFGNGITGLIKNEKVADDMPNQKDLYRLVAMRLPIQVRILRVYMDKFFVECTARVSDLVNQDFMPKKDPYYDEEAEKARLKLMQPEKPKPMVIPIAVQATRNVPHPSYKNITFMEAEAILKDMDQGDVIFRPSTKGFDVLSLTWNIAPGVLQHINIIEKKKRSRTDLGSVLLIGDSKYEDLDEIIARYVNPQAGFARDIMAHEAFREEDYEDPKAAYEYLSPLKQQKPKKTHFIITCSKKMPGKFILSFLPRSRDEARQAVFSLSPDGIWFGNKCFQVVDECIFSWKKAYKQSLVVPIPVAGSIQETIGGDPADTPEGDPKDTPEGDPKDTPEGDPEDTPDGDPEDTPEGDPKDTPEGDPKDTPEGDPEDTPDGDPEDTPEGDTADNTEGNHVDTSEGDTADNTEGNHVDTSEGDTADNTEIDPSDIREGNPVDTIEIDPADTTDYRKRGSVSDS